MKISKLRYKNYSDENLMELIRLNKSGAFDELYDRYSRRMLHYFYRMLGGNEELAQDFLQELFLKIVEKADAFRTDKKFSSWIFTLAANMCKNEYRRCEVRNRIGNDAHMPVEQSSQTERDVDRHLFFEALFRELGSIDIMQRSTFLLRHQQNYSIREIAEILDCSPGTVKSRLFYTSRKLAEKLKDFNPEVM